MINVLDAVIANGASESSAIQLNGAAIVGLNMPAAWTAANVTLLGSTDNATYNPIYDTAGIEATITASSARYIPLNPVSYYGIKWLKLRSGTAGTPVNQGAARTIQVATSEITE